MRTIEQNSHLVGTGSVMIYHSKALWKCYPNM